MSKIHQQSKANKVNEDWSDRKSWWMDLLKSLISYSAGALITIFLFILTLDRCQHKWQAKHDIKLDVLKEYENASLNSILMSYDALKDSRRYGKVRDSSADIKNWEDVVFDNLFIAENNLKYWYEINSVQNSDVYKNLHELDSLREQIKTDVDSGVNVYKRFTIDSLRGASWETYKEENWKPLKDKYMSTDSLILIRCRELLSSD